MLRRKRVKIEIHVGERFNANPQLNDNELYTRAGLKKEKGTFCVLSSLTNGKKASGDKWPAVKALDSRQDEQTSIGAEDDSKVK